MKRTKTVPMLLVLALLTICALPFGAAPLSAQELPQASSANALRRAEGIIFDTTELDPDPHWAFTGPFILACGPTPCAQATPSQIVFDMTLAMVRPDGAQSHSHSFSQFVGSSIEVVGDDLIIEGEIVGSGNVGGRNDVRIEFVNVSEAGEFRIELIGNSHIVGQLGGLITGSR